MTDIKYINATALQENVRQSYDMPLLKLYADALLEAAPAVNLQFQRRGMWRSEVQKIPVSGRGYGLHERVYCSECNLEPTGGVRTTFCDHCGVRMDIYSLDELDVYHADLEKSAYKK